MRNLMTVLFVAILTTSCGCSAMTAKRHAPVKSNAPVKTQRVSVKHKLSEQTQVACASQEQQQHGKLTAEELDDIRHAGDDVCFPSKVRIMEMQENEVLRQIEVDSGLSGEAVNDLLDLRDMLTDLEGDSNELNIDNSYPGSTAPKAEITSSGYEPSNKDFKYQHSLLNDSNSSLFSAVTKATPKYFEKLASVLTQLSDQEGFQLKITGDTSTKQADFNDMKLSTGPVKKSESFLQVMVEFKF